jgi:hypothetical protein
LARFLHAAGGWLSADCGVAFFARLVKGNQRPTAATEAVLPAHDAPHVADHDRKRIAGMSDQQNITGRDGYILVEALKLSV